MATGRWHIELAEEMEGLPLVRWEERATPDEAEAPVQSSLAPLLLALRHLAFRAGDPGSWAPPLAEDPLAFLLDALDETINVWSADGRLLYSNRAAADGNFDSAGRPGVTSFARDGRRFERRCLAFEAYGGTYVVEIVRELR
jgi:hypothetical protein